MNLQQRQRKVNINDFRLSNLVKLFPKAKSVLEIGTGAGVITRHLTQNYNFVTSIEIHEERFNELNRELKDIHNLCLFKMDCLNMQFNDNTFDLVVCTDVIEHIENDKAALKEIYRVLKPGGKIFISIPQYQYLFGKRDIDGGHYRRYSKKTIRALLYISRFMHLKIRNWNFIGLLPYWISEKILRKGLNPKFRKKKNRFLNFWFKYIENNLDFGMGLSIIAIGEK